MKNNNQPNPEENNSNWKKQNKSSIQSSDPLHRTVPQALELEAAILGMIMLEPDALERSLEIISAESFYAPKHQTVFRALLELQRKGMPCDLLTVTEHLRSQNKLDEVDGPYGLVSLTNAVVSSTNLVPYCEIVQQKFIRRELGRIGMEIWLDSFDESMDEFDQIEISEKKVMQIGDVNLRLKVITMDEALASALHQIEQWRKQDSWITGVPSGFNQLDKITRGFQPGNLIILAARPSIGKTAFALNLIRYAALQAEHPTPVAIWSLEMSVMDLILRMLAAQSETYMHKIQTGKLTDQEMDTLYKQGAEKLTKAKIYFDDSDHVSIVTFRSMARKLKKKFGIGLIVVDYLQLMSAEKAKATNREQEISFISRELKRLAKELQIPIIALSQLSREIEKRTGFRARPQLSDLRESGAIEQDADLVMFLYGPAEEEEAGEDKRYVKIAKHRNGVLTIAEFDFKNEIQVFSAINQITGTSAKWNHFSPTGNPDQFHEPDKDDDVLF